MLGRVHLLVCRLQLYHYDRTQPLYLLEDPLDANIAIILYIGVMDSTALLARGLHCMTTLGPTVLLRWGCGAVA